MPAITVLRGEYSVKSAHRFRDKVRTGLAGTTAKMRSASERSASAWHPYILFGPRRLGLWRPDRARAARRGRTAGRPADRPGRGPHGMSPEKERGHPEESPHHGQLQE